MHEHNTILKKQNKTKVKTKQKPSKWLLFQRTSFSIDILEITQNVVLFFRLILYNIEAAHETCLILI